MPTDKQQAALTWLNRQGQISLREGISEGDFRQLQGLIGHGAFGLFVALLANMRAEAAILLSNAKLGTPERDCAASVLQGQIRAIDAIRQTILDIADPSEVTAETDQQGARPHGQ